MIELSFLHSYNDLETALGAVLNLSKSQIKKFQLSKALLNKKIEAHSSIKLPCDVINRGEVNPCYDGPEVKIIFENEQLLVLDKPAGIHGHPLCYSDTKNILSAIRSMGRGDILRVNQEQHERGLLYRLDRETSGVLVYVKKQDLYEWAREHFSECAKGKIYFAEVCGEFPDHLEGTIQDTLAPFGPKGHMMRVSDNGEVARLEVKKIQFFADKKTTLLQVHLHTGLRHQIRVQLSHSGFPILGDELYGGGSADRLHLHAKEYVLSLGGQTCSFSSPLPWSKRD